MWVAKHVRFWRKQYGNTTKRRAKTRYLENKTSGIWRDSWLYRLRSEWRRSALGNIGWSGPDWSEFSDRPCDVIVRLITKKTNVWRWSALLSSALGDKFAGCQLCWDNYSSVCTLNDWQSSFFEEWMNVYMPLPFYLCLPLHSMLLFCTVAEDTT